MQVEKGGLLVYTPTENKNPTSKSETYEPALLEHVQRLADSLSQDPSRNVDTEATSALMLERIRKNSIDLVVLPVADGANSLLQEILDVSSPPSVLMVGESQQSELVADCIQQGAGHHYLFDNRMDSGVVNGDQLLISLVDNAMAQHDQLRITQQQVVELGAELDHVTHDQKAAFDVQKQLLPEPQNFGDISFSYRILPRQGMSGDCVNCIELSDGRLLFYLSDVAGHGVLGGVIATTLTLTAKNLANENFDPKGLSSSDLLNWFNRAMLELNLERHVTMFLGVISSNRSELQYSSAAHFPGTILCQDDCCVYLELGGLPLGICETEYEAKTVNLSETFELVLFSDGVLEILPQDSLENRENHLISLVESGARNVSGLSNDLGLEGQTLEGRSKIPDDIAVLTLHRTKLRK